MAFDPDFCEHRCPVCTRARRGGPIARLVQRIELLLTFGGCPWGRARRRRYGVRPDQPVPGARPPSPEPTPRPPHGAPPVP